MASDAAYKEDRRKWVEERRELEGRLAETEEGQQLALAEERRLRSQEMDQMAKGAVSERDALLEAEKEKRVEHLKSVAIRRIALKDLARGWMGWHGMWADHHRRKRILLQAANRLGRPKLTAAYQSWRREWQVAETLRAGKSDKQQLAEAVAKASELQTRLSDVSEQLAASQSALAKFEGATAGLEQQMADSLEAEKEKRVEHLKSVAIRRIALKDLARGWMGWHGVWSEKVRQRNLLKKAGARLTKPKLLAAYSGWRKDWEAEYKVRASMTMDQKLAEEARKRAEAEAEANKLRKELDAARSAASSGTGREAEMQRLAEAELEKEKEKRVEHLKSVAIRRIALKDLARGWMGWHGTWSEKVRQRNLLKQAGARLTKPKLLAAYGMWRKDWDYDVAVKAAKSSSQLLRDEQSIRAAAEDEARALKAELTKLRDAALNGDAREIEIQRRLVRGSASLGKTSALRSHPLCQPGSCLLSPPLVSLFSSPYCSASRLSPLLATASLHRPLLLAPSPLSHHRRRRRRPTRRRGSSTRSSARSAVWPTADSLAGGLPGVTSTKLPSTSAACCAQLLAA